MIPQQCADVLPKGKNGITQLGRGLIKGAERQHFFFAANARPAFFGPMTCLEFLFLSQWQVEESCARLEEGERGCGERWGRRLDGGPPLVRERRLVGREHLGEGNGD